MTTNNFNLNNNPHHQHSSLQQSVSRMNLSNQVTNGLFIRKEIQRFESVHPNIYSVYDLIDSISDFNLQQQIREHIVNIEDSFVNSQEWTLGRSVPDIKIGILGANNSGKSSLVHRFLTGTYMQEESPEGGRFKKEVIIDGQSYLLLIRDEGGPPEMQFSHWVDAVIFVFSLENEESFMSAHQLFNKLHNYRNVADIPILLVGTQDFISETNPRVIDDARAHSLANKFQKCGYFETCATYGLNVERVFHDACQKVVNSRAFQVHQVFSSRLTPVASAHCNFRFSNVAELKSDHLAENDCSNSSSPTQSVANVIVNNAPPSVFKEPLNYQENKKTQSNKMVIDIISKPNKELYLQPESKPENALITPCSTPNQKRKDTNRRRSNLFTPNKKEDKQNKLNDMGIGRSIPVKQGFLYKKTNSTINKDWKKKFVTLNADGSLRYYPSINDYMDNSHGKEIDLQKTTIKIPGANKPRIGKSVQSSETNRLNNEINLLNLNNPQIIISNGDGTKTNEELVLTNVNNNMPDTRPDPNSKKRHRRVKSAHKSDQNKDEDQEGFEFVIISLDSKQWHFEATSNDEREEWVQAIEQQILSSLQSNETNKFKSKNGGPSVDTATILNLKNVPGNFYCADCDEPNPVWASLNYGSLICIECSGIHRNLGTHLSRVRSLELDDWSNELIQIMTSIGNRTLNSVYESNTKSLSKPNPNSPRDEKEKWIRAKYESKNFLATLPNKDVPVSKQLVDAVNRQEISNVFLCLAHCKPIDINLPVSPADRRTCLHLAASLANIVMLQLLIWYGADPESTDNQGRNALFYARQSNSTECVQLLIHNGCRDTLSSSTSTVTMKKTNTSISTSHICTKDNKLQLNII